jgi:diadenosine tetraphosphatase ApaH/serine/threonine PP2A family protein phosphatase
VGLLQVDAARVAAVDELAARGMKEGRRPVHGAQPVKRQAGERYARAQQLVRKEPQVEAGVVGDDGASGDRVEHVRRDLRERRRAGDIGGGDPVHVGRPHVALWVDQRGPVVLDLTAVGDEDDADLHDTVVLLRYESGGLHIDHCVAGHAIDLPARSPPGS